MSLLHHPFNHAAWFCGLLGMLLASGLLAQAVVPAQYVCYQRNSAQALVIDGQLNEPDWALAAATAPFMDIEGPQKPTPYYHTHVKMLWDQQYFYIAAELEEQHLWATYNQRDMVIFHENDFEVFIDPNGDTHHYYELEINALGTIWDLMLTKPYRDGGKAIDAWHIHGLLHGVHCLGTLNDPRDLDQKWTLELAIPWQVLEEAALHRGPPSDGEQWRVNFSRVQWRTQAQPSGYQKAVDPSTGKPYPEYNWVWSPQGVIAMHQPETWGLVQFATQAIGQGTQAFNPNPHETIKWQLRQLYYAQMKHRQSNGAFATSPQQLSDWPQWAQEWKNLSLWSDQQTFIASIPTKSLTWYIREDGYVWSVKYIP